MPSGPRPDPPARVATLSVRWENEAYPASNVYHVRAEGSGVVTEGDIVTLADGIVTAVGNNLLDIASESVLYTEVQAVYFTGSGTLEAFSTIGSNGTMTGQSFTAQVTPCVSWRVAGHYRGGHPRTYLPPPAGAEVLVDVTTWDGGYTAAVEDAAGIFLDNVNNIETAAHDNWQLGCVSFQTAGAWRTPPIFRPFLTSGIRCDSRVDTQRRRLGADRT